MTPARIVFVTGKGGAGKSAVARALVRAAQERGQGATLVTVASPSASPGVIERNPLPTVVRAEAALASFTRRLVPLGFVADRLVSSRTFRALAAAAPGLSDLIVLDAIAALADDGPGDIVVVDAPASGHALKLVAAPAALLEAAALSPVAPTARRLGTLVGDPRRFVPVVVATPEEFSLTETRETLAALSRLHVPARALVLNTLAPDTLGADAAAWIDKGGGSVDAASHSARRRREQALVERLCPSEPQRFDLPDRSDGGPTTGDVAQLLDVLLPNDDGDAATVRGPHER